MKISRWIKYIFCFLVSVSLLATALVSKELLFPFITTKAFFFRSALELALPFYIYLLLSHKNLRPNLKHPLNFLVLGFLFVNLASAIFGGNVTKSLWGNFERMGGVYYLAHLVLLYFYVLCLGQIGGSYIKGFLKALLAVSALITLNGISGVLGGPTLTLDPSLPSRASSTLGNPIFFASFLILPLAFAVFFALQAEKTSGKIIYWLLAILQLIGIIQSGTRGAVVGLGLGIFLAAVIYVVFSKERKIKLYGSIATLVFAVIVILLFAFHNNLPQGSTVRRVFNLKDSNTNSRLIQWQIALKGVKDYPLLGTGSENYYIVGNKYYNNELYAYDRSWFDKPHNYLLEILTTNGILGFALYLGLMLAALRILWRAYKSGLLSWLEACLFLAGLLVYQIQNLFVFDTIPASLMFYAFLGFLSFLESETNLKDLKKGQHNLKALPKGLVIASSGLSFACVIYLVVATNIIPAKVSQNVNYGFAYSSVDPYKAAKYFEEARTSPFNFDFAETASKFGDFAVSLVRSQLVQSDPSFVDNQLSLALNFQKQAASRAPNDPVVLQKLANVLFYTAVFKKTAIPLEALETTQRAINLAPKRVEARLLLAQLRLYQGFAKEAAEIMEEVSRLDPTNKETKWQLALVYHDAERLEEGVDLAQKLLDEGYRPTSNADLSWLVDYYINLNQKDKALAAAEKNLQFQPENVKSAAVLYGVYVKFGMEDRAKVLLEEYKKFQPKLWPELEKLIQPSS